MPTVYLAGGEDIEFGELDGGTISTTSGEFRSSYSRCALKVRDTSLTGPINEPNSCLWRNFNAFNQTEFWFTGRVKHSNNFRNGMNPIFRLTDGSGVPRLQMRNYDYGIYHVETINGSGTKVQIGNSALFDFSDNIIDKIDVHCRYDTVGFLDIYVNGILVYNFAGDNTTNGVTELAFVDLMNACWTGYATWSEIIVADIDTRSLSLKVFPPVANGHANTFDTGSPAAANINETTLDDSTLNGSTTAGQIDQYTNGAVPSGTLDVIDLIISARAQRGNAGITKIALGARTNGTDYWGSDQLLVAAWGNIQEHFYNNPDTSVPWLKTEIGAAVGFNVGSKSAA